MWFGSDDGGRLRQPAVSSGLCNLSEAEIRASSAACVLTDCNMSVQSSNAAVKGRVAAGLGDTDKSQRRDMFHIYRSIG